MDGTRFRKELYPKLAEVYEDGVIPDLRGIFIRGLGGNSAELLTLQQDAVISHRHRTPTSNGSRDTTPSKIQYEVATDGYFSNGVNYFYHGYDYASTGISMQTDFNDGGANETRSINRAFNYICWTGETYI